MVCSHFYTTSPASLCTTSLSTTQTHDRLPHNVALPFSSHVRTPPIIKMVRHHNASLIMATTTLAEVQTQLLTILAPQSGPTSILIGHSLESDLKVLRICHPLCIDTALMYHPRCRPLKPGLAWLTKKWSARDSDARACVERACGRDGQGTVRAVVVDHGHPGVIHGTKETTAIGCGSDREVLQGLI